MASVVNNSFTSVLDVPDATRSYLDDVERQFTISDDRLCTITKRFIDDFAVGLAEYGKSMAMMCVAS